MESRGFLSTGEFASRSVIDDLDYVGSGAAQLLALRWFTELKGIGIEMLRR